MTNLLEWFLYISSMLFAAPILRNQMTDWQWTFGSITIFLAWFNCLLFLQRYGLLFDMSGFQFLDLSQAVLQYFPYKCLFRVFFKSSVILYVLFNLILFRYL